MTSFWSLFILFVGFNLGFTMVSEAFVNSSAFFVDTDDDGIGDTPNTNLSLGTPFPTNLEPAFNDECNRQGTAGTNPPNATTLISELCTKANIQNQQLNSSVSGSQGIANQEDVGFFSWVGQISDFGQMLVFGIQLLLGAITGDFIISVLNSLFIADELPAEFEIGVRIIVGLMWVALFYAMVFARSPTGQ